MPSNVPIVTMVLLDELKLEIEWIIFKRRIIKRQSYNTLLEKINSI
jgi:hypothetical protein